MKTLKVVFIAMFLLAAVFAPAQEIFDAINKNDLEKTKQLIEKDSSLIKLKDKEGNQPLHNAANIGSVSIAEYLLSKGADINAVNVSLNTPLLVAIVNKQEDVAKFLIEKGADFNLNTIRIWFLH